MITLAETAKLLALCAAFDQRTTGEADVEAWHQVFSLNRECDYELAQKRIIDWYSRERERIMPADILDPHVNTGGLW